MLLRKLQNGYTVIAEKPEENNTSPVIGTIVLAVNSVDNQYAVWWYRVDDGTCFQGEYFPFFHYANESDQFEAASTAFLNRKGY